MISVRNLFFQCLASSLVLFFLGCASTNFESDLKQIRIGDDKSRVLEVLGNPRRTLRVNSVDRWIYTYPKDGLDHTEIIEFQNGKVIKTADKSSNKDANVTPENAETYEEYEKSVLKRRKK